MKGEKLEGGRGGGEVDGESKGEGEVFESTILYHDRLDE